MDEFMVVVKRAGGPGYIRARAFSATEAAAQFAMTIDTLRARGFRGRVNQAGIARLGKWEGLKYVRVSVFIEHDWVPFSPN